MAKALVLFDVDGTLLITGGASSRCIRRACQHLWGDRFRWTELTVGTLDQEIFASLARASGIERPEADLPRYKRQYLLELDRELHANADQVKVMPGVRELLTQLAERSDVIIGLLSGNFREAVALKLRAAGLDQTIFRVGTFAEDGQRRCELVPAALAKLATTTGDQLAPAQVILVGDTPRDISCAREAGCRVLAVATGRYGQAELEAHGPDRVVADLSDPTPLMALIDEIVFTPDVQPRKIPGV